VSEGVAVIRAEAVIGSEKRGGRLADGVHLALVEAIEAGMAGGGIVTRPGGAGGSVCGAHRVRGEVEIGLLVHLPRLSGVGGR
jgi:hypothetical protein